MEYFNSELEEKLHFVMFKDIVNNYVYQNMLTFNGASIDYEWYLILHIEPIDIQVYTKFLKPFRLRCEYSMTDGELRICEIEKGI